MTPENITTPQNEASPSAPSLSDHVAAAVAKIPEYQLQDAVAWTAEYLRQLKERLPDQHLCAFSMAMDGTCFICGKKSTQDQPND